VAKDSGSADKFITRVLKIHNQIHTIQAIFQSKSIKGEKRQFNLHVEATLALNILQKRKTCINKTNLGKY